jgi:hypothetical protein
MPNTLIHCGDFTLACSGNLSAASTVRRSKAQRPSGVSRVGRNQDRFRVVKPAALIPRIELHLNGADKLVRLLPAVNDGVSGAGGFR